MKKLFFISILSIILTVPLIVGAADTVTIPNPLKTDSITGLIGIIGGILQVAAVTIGVIMIIIAGIQYMTSAGNEEKAKKAKQTIVYTLIGVAIVTAANFIVQLVSEILDKVK